MEDEYIPANEKIKKGTYLVPTQKRTLLVIGINYVINFIHSVIVYFINYIQFQPKYLGSKNIFINFPFFTFQCLLILVIFFKYLRKKVEKKRKIKLFE